MTTIAIPAEKRLLTFDDALAAADALAEISAGHEDGAERVLTASGLDGLGTDELEALCARFGTGA